MTFIEGFFPLVGRLLLAAIFLGTAVGFIHDPAGTQEKMRGVQMHKLYEQDERTVPVLMWAAVGCLVVGGVSVVFGYKARFGAFLLIAFLAAATYFFHPVWKFQGSKEFQPMMIDFLKNCAIGGGLFIVLARGAGRWSIDGVRPTYDDY